MKQTLFTILLLASPALIAQGPADIANHTVRIQMTGAQVARSAMYQPETLPWHTWKEQTISLSSVFPFSFQNVTQL